MLHVNFSALDYAIIASYFLVVVGIGAIARLSVKTDVDFFLTTSAASRSKPAGSTSISGRRSG